MGQLQLLVRHRPRGDDAPEGTALGAGLRAPEGSPPTVRPEVSRPPKRPSATRHPPNTQSEPWLHRELGPMLVPLCAHGGPPPRPPLRSREEISTQTRH